MTRRGFRSKESHSMFSTRLRAAKITRMPLFCYQIFRRGA